MELCSRLLQHSASSDRKSADNLANRVAHNFIVGRTMAFANLVVQYGSSGFLFFRLPWLILSHRPDRDSIGPYYSHICGTPWGGNEAYGVPSNITTRCTRSAVAQARRLESKQTD